ncbi:MAG: LysR family transcriptional regulator [Myxococcota bacterium]
MNWDDVRFALALSKAGSLARAARELEVDHTTVGRRVEAAEEALGAKLFTRTSTGFVLTREGERLLAPMRAAEEAMLALERAAHSHQEGLEGPVRVTSPETFGVCYLAPRLATFGRAHPGLSIELLPSGDVLDLGRRQAELAVRFFRSQQQDLVVRRVGEMGYALYGSRQYLSAHPLRAPGELRHHRILGAPGTRALEAVWLKRLCAELPAPSFTSELSIALLGAVRAHAGVAVLPRYLGDPEPSLVRVHMPDEPKEPLWLTVHRDLKDTPRVRVLLDFLATSLRDDQALLRGRS